MAKQFGRSFTAEDFRNLARAQNEVFKPTGFIPRFKDFPPAKANLILTCMDPRVEPYDFWDLGSAPLGIVRNAGGRAAEFLKSAEFLTAAMGMGGGSLGTVAVVHHTDCGLLNLGDQFVKDKIKNRTPGLTSEQVKDLDEKRFGEMHDIDESVREDMDLIKNDPYLPKDLEVIGFVYDSFTGKTYEVV